MRTNFLFFLPLLIPISANARISSAETAGSLFNKAEVILKGEVISIRDGAVAVPAGGSDMTTQYLAKIGAKPRLAEFRVDRAIKGDVSENTVEVLFYELTKGGADAPPIYLTQGEYLIAFLKKDGSRYKFPDLDHGKIQVRKPARVNKVPKAEARKAMREEFMQMLRDTDPEVSSSGIQLLGELGEKEALLPELKKLRGSGNPKLRKKSLLWLARSGDRESVNSLVAAIKAEGKGAGNLENGEALDAIGNSKDAGAAGPLSELLKHENVYVRRKAMESLRKLKNRSALPKIVEAFDDSDEIVRYDAMMTTCEMANAKPVGCPSTMLFKQNPEKYIGEWKAWWASHKDVGR